LLPRLLPRRSAHLEEQAETAHRPFETCGGSSTWHRPTKLPFIQKG
jgi:hypothetical protein